MKEYVIDDTTKNRQLMSRDKRIKATPISGNKLLVEMPEDNEVIPGSVIVEQIND